MAWPPWWTCAFSTVTRCCLLPPGADLARRREWRRTGVCLGQVLMARGAVAVPAGASMPCRASHSSLVSLTGASMRCLMGAPSLPPCCIDSGRSFPTSVRNAAGFLSACSVRYSTPPAAARASRIISLTSRDSLFVAPREQPRRGRLKRRLPDSPGM